MGTYDNFNRLKTRDYSDSTPDVDFYYDGRGLAFDSRIFERQNDASCQFGFGNPLHIIRQSRQTALHSEQRTPFADETAENATPRVSTYQYNLTSLVSQTYPSGRTVKMDYDQDGDVASVWGTVGSTNRLYANAIHYNSAGAIERLRLGNGKWETAEYNIRSANYGNRSGQFGNRSKFFETRILITATTRRTTAH